MATIYIKLYNTLNHHFCLLMELNSQVKHYTTRCCDRKHVFAFWFGDCIHFAKPSLAA